MTHTLASLYSRVIFEIYVSPPVQIIIYSFIKSVRKYSDIFPLMAFTFIVLC